MVVVWQKDQMKIRFDSLDDGWFASGDELKQSERSLVQLINWRLESNDRLTFAVELPQEFIDEHAKVCKVTLAGKKLLPSLNYIWSGC